MKNNSNLTPEQLEFLSLWSQGYSYVDIAKQIGKDESTLRRWRKREDIQLAMGAISQQKHLYCCCSLEILDRVSKFVKEGKSSTPLFYIHLLVRKEKINKITKTPVVIKEVDILPFQ